MNEVLNFFIENQIEYLPQIITCIYFLIVTFLIAKTKKEVFKEMLLENVAKLTIGFLLYFMVPFSLVVGILYRFSIIDKQCIPLKYFLIYPINYGFSLVVIAIGISIVGKVKIKDINTKLLTWDQIVLCILAWISCGVFLYNTPTYIFIIALLLVLIFYIPSICRFIQIKYPKYVPRCISEKMDNISKNSKEYQIEKRE
ncbi:hypothetical protein [Mannheimia indoligenes]|uniref:hypothetical protein n=1 Tax=Mannheimia indoligenes TaxID=3103145 RepID=UPI002FE64810